MIYRVIHEVILVNVKICSSLKYTQYHLLMNIISRLTKKFIPTICEDISKRLIVFIEATSFVKNELPVST